MLLLQAIDLLNNFCLLVQTNSEKNLILKQCIRYANTFSWSKSLLCIRKGRSLLIYVYFQVFTNKYKSLEVELLELPLSIAININPIPNNIHRQKYRVFCCKFISMETIG